MTQNVFQKIAQSRFFPIDFRLGYIYYASRIWKKTVSKPLRADIDNVGSMTLDIWDFIPCRLFFFGVWEPSISAAMRDALVPGSYAIDIGANIGYYTLLMAQGVGPQGRVLAFEPVPETRNRLEKHVAMNSCSNVTVLPYGISDMPEKRAIQIPERNTGAASFGEVAEDGLQLGELSDFADAEFLSRVSVIKIDVEGMENKVLRSLLTIVDQLAADVAIFVEIRPTDEIREILEVFTARGFRMLILENDYGLRRYADPTAVPPRPITELEAGQQDLVLARGSKFQ